MNDRLKNKNFQKWIVIITLSLTLIGSSVLIYQWEIKESSKLVELEAKLAQLEQEREKQRKQGIEQHQFQQKQLDLIFSLTQKPDIKDFFSNLLQTYAQKFADSQNINISAYPLSFGSFYQIGNQETNQLEAQTKKLGNATFDTKEKQTIISLNQLYLFNKLGHDRYFANPELYLEISFPQLIKTCSHELAHYIQYVKYQKSSCYSSYGTSKYVDWLAQEHKKLSQQIYQLITNSPDYSQLEKQWKEI